MGPIGSGVGGGRGASSYFNKNGGPMGSAGNNGLPVIQPKGGLSSNNLGSYANGVNKNSAIGNRNHPPGIGSGGPGA